MKILVVEDDRIIHKSICTGLRKFGYAADSAFDGEEALVQYEINSYDAIILDLNLPKLDGIEVLKKIRMSDDETKILILSARAELDDKITGLDCGANDYLAKPFHFRELEARLRALLRRQFIQSNTIITYGNIRVDTSGKKVDIDRQHVALTKKEYSILEYLLLNKGKIISSEELIEHIWDSEADLFSSSFKVHLNTLRKKLSALIGDRDIIKNTRGMGYYISEDNNEDI